MWLEWSCGVVGWWRLGYTLKPHQRDPAFTSIAFLGMHGPTTRPEAPLSCLICVTTWTHPHPPHNPQSTPQSLQGSHHHSTTTQLENHHHNSRNSFNSTFALNLGSAPRQYGMISSLRDKRRSFQKYFAIIASPPLAPHLPIPWVTELFTTRPKESCPMH